jgi:Fungal Zn(2)-Cys(6) binuclear cluster domain.
MTSRHSHLSIRTACGRCRSQKLRCSLATQESDDEPRQCTRCQRAKTDCVFSRRRRLGDSYKAIPEQARQTSQSSSLPSVDSPSWLWGYQDGSLTDATSNPEMFPQLSTLFTESNVGSLVPEWMEMGSRHYIDCCSPRSPRPISQKRTMMAPWHVLLPPRQLLLQCTTRIPPHRNRAIRVRQRPWCSKYWSSFPTFRARWIL